MQKIWLHYQRNIIATDIYAAVFLAAFSRHASIQRLHSFQMEILDCDKQKVMTAQKKVHKACIGIKRLSPFQFIVCKN